ncbi:MAG: radical SAM/SPASM domain protein, ACGX system [Clostridiales bacterium]|nr:radical SAM/SPASM domain protein, ACGX system [Clostridiales bacterium]
MIFKRRSGTAYMTFQWHITDACDQRCKHCYIYGAGEDFKPCAMAWQDMLDTLENCEVFCDQLDMKPCLCITGGDPLLHPDFWRLAETLHRRKIPFSILGNPFHLTMDVCRRLKKLGCTRYQLSVDGLEKTHDALRRPGSFRETLDKIPMLKKARIETAVMTTVSSLNIGEMPGIVDAVVAAGADVYAFARYCPVRMGETNGITPLAYRDLLYRMGEKFRSLMDAGCRTWFAKKDHLWTLYDYENGRFTPPATEEKVVSGGCSCGIAHLTILPNGDVCACRRVPDSVVGNVLHQDLGEIWGGPMNPYRQLDQFEKCAGCELGPWCRGCPAVAKSTSGSFCAPDPQCWKTL